MSFARILAAGVSAAAVICTAGAASASEAWIGVYAHDLGPAARERGTQDIQIGYRTERVEAWTYLFKPQVHVLASFNTSKNTHFAAVGLSWPIRLTDALYIRPGMGIAYTTGEAGLPPANAPGLTQAEIDRRVALNRSRIDFGSKVLFEPELALGYHFSDSWSAELSWTHLSNGQILHQGKNQGLDDVGARLIKRF